MSSKQLRPAHSLLCTRVNDDDFTQVQVILQHLEWVFWHTTCCRATELQLFGVETCDGMMGCSIADLTDLLQKKERVLEVVETEAQELARRFGRPRRSLICSEAEVRPSAAAMHRDSLEVQADYLTGLVTHRHAKGRQTQQGTSRNC